MLYHGWRGRYNRLACRELSVLRLADQCALCSIEPRGIRAYRGDIDGYDESAMETSVQGEATLTFWWKVSSESGYDELEFYLDDVLKHSISGEVDWQQKSYNATGPGSHTLRWRRVSSGGFVRS